MRQALDGHAAFLEPRLYLGIHRGHPLHERRKDRQRVLPGRAAQIELEAAIARQDVARGAALHDADGQRGVRRGERTVRIGLRLQRLGQFHQFVHQADRHIVGRNAQMRQAAMRLMPAHAHLVQGDALVARHHRHAGRLTHHGEHRCGHMPGDAGDHVRRALAADLLVIAQRNVHGPPPLPEQRHRGQCQRDERLHVAGPAPVQLAVALGHHPRIARPVLPVDRHDIAMAGQDHPARHIRADSGVEIGLVACRIRHPPPGNAEVRQIGLDPFDQRQIAEARGGVERHQRLQDRAALAGDLGAGDLGAHAAPAAMRSTWA